MLMRTLLTFCAVALCLCACGKEQPAAAKHTPKAPPASETAAAAKGDQPAKPVNLHDAGPPGDATKGADVFGRICVACHQKDGSGMNGMLAANFKTDKTRLAQPDSVLLKSIAEGKKGEKLTMPPQKGVLTEQEIKDVLAYVRKTFGVW